MRIHRNALWGLLAAPLLAASISSVAFAYCSKCLANPYEFCNDYVYCCAISCQVNGGVCELIGPGQCGYVEIESMRLGGHLVSIRVFALDPGAVGLVRRKGMGAQVLHGLDGAGSRRIGNQLRSMYSTAGSQLGVVASLDVLGTALGRRITSSEGDGFAFLASPSAGRLDVSMRRLVGGEAEGTTESQSLYPGDVILTMVRIGTADYIVTLQGLALEPGLLPNQKANEAMAKIVADSDPVTQGLGLTAMPVLSLDDKSSPAWARISAP